jgi:Fe-S-cluster containining protein
MADHLKLTEADFKKRYVRTVFGRMSLREDPDTFDCVFLKEKRCQIYAERPRQCKTFPWWKENLATPEAWEETAKRCEGINHVDAPVVSCETILENL